MSPHIETAQIETENLVSMLPYPRAHREEYVARFHGKRAVDQYRWLEERLHPRTTEWVAAQDVLCDDVVRDLGEIDAMNSRLRRLRETGEAGVPIWCGDRAFFGRRESNSQQACVLVREPEGEERVLLDPDVLFANVNGSIVDWFPSLDGNRLAYLLVDGADETSSLYVIDVDTCEQLDGPISRTGTSDVSWLRGGEKFVYVREEGASTQGSSKRVLLHTVGADPDVTDVEIVGSDLSEGNSYWFGASSEGDWLTIHASSGTTTHTDVWLSALTSTTVGEPQPVQRDLEAWTLAWVSQNQLYLLTDYQAPRGRLCVADPHAVQVGDWVTVVPHDRQATLSDAVVLDDGMILASHIVDAGSTLSWYGDSGRGGKVGGLRPGTISALTARNDGGRQAWISYSDFVTPEMVLTWSVDEPDSVQVWAEAPGSVELPDIDVQEPWYQSVDGTQVHAFVVARTDAPPGPRPTVLTGYGGFSSSQTPAYSAMALAWVEAGGVWVVANVRGGSEFGEEWHQAGIRANKQRSFDDFAAVATGLVADGWTTQGRLGLIGASNGGLLVAATIIQNPGICAAVVCASPILDMIRYERFGIGHIWSDEYGSAEVAEEFEWLSSYSPYHHVEKGVEYPATLFTVSESDERVDPLHARKMCAAMQYATSSSRPILLCRDEEGSHVARTVSQDVRRSGVQLGFLAWCLDLMEGCAPLVE